VTLLFGSFGNQRDKHPLAFQFGQAFDFPHIYELLGKSEKQQFTPFFIDNGPTPKMNVGPHFGSLLKEVLGVFELKLKIMIIGIGPKTNFFDQILGGMGFDFLLFFLFLVLEFAIIYYPTNRRSGCFRNEDQIEPQFFSYM